MELAKGWKATILLVVKLETGCKGNTIRIVKLVTGICRHLVFHTRITGSQDMKSVYFDQLY